MTSHLRRVWISLLPLLVAAPLAGQMSIQAGPLVGYYRPTGSFDPPRIYSTSLPREPQDLSAAAFGGEARIWFSERVGAQLRLMTATSALRSVNTPLDVARPGPARVTAGSAQLLIEVLTPPGGSRVWLGAGPGLVHHGGEAYDEFGSQLDPAGVADVAGSIPISGDLSAIAGLTVLFYFYDVAMPVELQANGASLQKGWRQDALLHAGINWNWN